ncbi:MAG TPA: alcohol dehydrogenase catalytic domain-containing protein, partial [Cyclobacteriaceae bacterium]
MKAYHLTGVHDLKVEKAPLKLVEVDVPIPNRREILIKIKCCGICHTEIDEIEGRTPPAVYPVIPGHQVVGEVSASGSAAIRFKQGTRVGVAWINMACGNCEKCKSGVENLCELFRATGRDVNGGYAKYITVHEDYAYFIPDAFTNEEAAPLLCSGAIGYRSLKLTGLHNGKRLGLTGFGASGHLVLKLSKYLYPDSEVFVFARSAEERAFAESLGAHWAGDTNDSPPHKLFAIIDTTPAWKPVVNAMDRLESGGRLVINAIRKESLDQEELLNLNYEKHLWMEKEIKSVANITRQDVEEFLKIAAEIPIKPKVKP